MIISGSIRPLSTLEDLELRRERLAELIALGLVSPTLTLQLRKAIAELDLGIARMKHATLKRAAA